MKFCQVLLITNKTVIDYYYYCIFTTRITIKSFNIDDHQAVCCLSCGKSSGLEFDQNMCFCDCGFIGGEDAIKPCKQMIRFKVSEEQHQHKTFVITSTMIQEVFKEKIENRKLLGFKMIKAKVTITADEVVTIKCK